jgi:cysteine-rich secretory family protein
MADPTAQEILDWALINRSRLDPAGEAARSGVDLNEGPPTDGNGNVITLTAASKQPLAWNNALYGVADQHSLDMFNNLPGKTWLTGLYHNDVNTQQANLTKAGYSFSWWGENVSVSLPLTAQYTVTQGIYDQHKALFFDNFANNATYRRGHRVNILNDNFQEVGVGEFTGTFQGETRSLITEDFGRPSTSGQFLTGIAYNDNDGDKFYSVGEGRANISVATSGGTATTATAGNYSRAIAAGDQTITFSNGDLGAPVTV